MNKEDENDVSYMQMYLEIEPSSAIPGRLRLTPYICHTRLTPFLAGIELTSNTFQNLKGEQ